MITFNELEGKNRSLNDQYPTGLIDWGHNQWWLSGPYGDFDTKNITFKAPGQKQARFVFLEPKRLVRLDVYNGAEATTTLAIRCPGQAAVVVEVAAQQLVTIETGWTEPCPWVLLWSRNGQATHFDNFVLDKGVASPAPVPPSSIERITGESGVPRTSIPDSQTCPGTTPLE